MTKLSVNVNKIATLRNARGGSNPSVMQVALDCERFGAQGITVHPRPDERHITRQDVYDLAKVVTVEFNIEGYPDDRFMKIIEEVRPAQATLVPDPPDVLTSNAGWNTAENKDKLIPIIEKIKSWGVRTSLFVDPVQEMIIGANRTGSDRIELYTEAYAGNYPTNPEEAVSSYQKAAVLASELELGINAGHDLDLNNLRYFKQNIPNLEEVSIGHALISDALYFGLENSIGLYLRKLDSVN
ncbi:MAG: pyridoxine 5'-phosphate synthase [Cytophagales bacterium]|nr:pyridoxine 5'-phosphate synthase [Cytophagales bacterium]